MRLSALILAAFLSAPASAQTDPSTAALNAARMLEQASINLSEAEGARDRVRALTETIQAYEAGLSAMRDGLRIAATREAQLTAELRAREKDVAQLLGVLQTIETTAPPVLMLHPSGPLARREPDDVVRGYPGSECPCAGVGQGSARGPNPKVASTECFGNIGRRADRGARCSREAQRSYCRRTDLPRRFVEDPVRTAF